MSVNLEEREALRQVHRKQKKVSRRKLSQKYKNSQLKAVEIASPRRQRERHPQSVAYLAKPKRKLSGARRAILVKPLTTRTADLRDRPIVGKIYWIQAKKTARVRIDDLYDELNSLYTKSYALPDDQEIQDLLSTRLAELRILQRQEASAIHAEFLESLEYPLGSGVDAVNDAEDLLAKYAHPASDHQTNE